MTITEALKHIEHFVFIEPGLLAKSILRDFKKLRNANLAALRIKGADLCCWCNVGKIIKPNRRYCSDGCVSSAFAYCNPNTPTAKGYILMQRQQCACAGCGTLYEKHIISKVINYLKERDERNSDERRKELGLMLWPDKTPYTYIFHNTGWFIQVDHIHPIFRGGSGIGLHNIQVLCIDCHKEKTRLENISQGSRKKTELNP